jgi:hypothetical protein
MNKRKCKQCGTDYGLSTPKQQYARLFQVGLTREQIRAAMPLCQMCVTKLRRHVKRMQQIAP